MPRRIARDIMSVALKPDGGFAIKAPAAKAGDYIDLRTEMNIIAAVSACPNESNPSTISAPSQWA